ncbi:cupin-like domain-containing protein [Burkholderia sp. BCC0405]|uniref:cupin-like domain-containing protein n=1 Tax=Burkholderia sp. BCC0405 TaxID=2676298 RepID=UPI00158E37A6|nr:cupin-like domain-containing protein [Burkholderia sp. BCC0405]
MRTNLYADVVENALFAAEFLSQDEFAEGRLWTIRKKRALQRHANYHGDAPAPIEILAAPVTPEQLRRATRRYRIPVVIRGMMAGEFAVTHWGQGDYLAQLCGDSSYRVVRNNTDDDSLGRKLVFGETTVGDLLAGIRGGHDIRYLAGVSQIFIDHPELLDDLNLPKLSSLFGSDGLRKRFDAMNMFIGGPGTRSRIHCAFAGNFFLNLVGRKRWRLLAPEYRHLLLPVASRPFIYATTYFDPLDESPERHSFAQTLPFFEVTLEPGDVLYNGPWWWHQVENLEPLNIGCAIRVGQFRADLANNATFTLLSMQPKVYALRMLFLWEKLLKRNDDDFRTYVLRFLHRQQVQRTLNQARNDG